MKINNRREIIRVMFGFSILLFSDIIFLLFAGKLFSINLAILQICFSLIFILSIWRLSTLKIFSMEISEHILSIKYGHPFLNIRQPSLELPLQKIIFFKIEKGIINHFLIISIDSKRGIRSFYYKLGKLSKNRLAKLKAISDLVASSRTRDESLL